MSEILSYPNIVDDNGDVGIDPEAMQWPLPIPNIHENKNELFADHSPHAEMAEMAEMLRPVKKDIMPKINPLHVANEKRLHLVNAIRLIGRSNRAQGATLRGDVDRAKFGGEAEAHAMNFTEQARQEIETACDMCAVRGLCLVVKSLLHERLEEDSTARRRLRDRLNADNVKGKSDTITCERYMAKERITNADR